MAVQIALRKLCGECGGHGEAGPSDPNGEYPPCHRCRGSGVEKLDPETWRLAYRAIRGLNHPRFEEFLLHVEPPPDSGS